MSNLDSIHSRSLRRRAAEAIDNHFRELIPEAHVDAIHEHSGGAFEVLVYEHRGGPEVMRFAELSEREVIGRSFEGCGTSIPVRAY